MALWLTRMPRLYDAFTVAAVAADAENIDEDDVQDQWKISDKLIR